MGAKKLKYPKKPKTTAPLSTWERYMARVKEVDKINSQIDSDKKKKAALIAKARK
jgi:hypothetical protein